ncbi:hypothetical protein L3Q82_024399, partial [Scortum barcoo]
SAAQTEAGRHSNQDSGNTCQTLEEDTQGMQKRKTTAREESQRHLRLPSLIMGSLQPYYSHLTGRAQYVRLQHCVLTRVASNTGAPQGTVLSPFLFTLYTADFNYNTSNWNSMPRSPSLSTPSGDLTRATAPLFTAGISCSPYERCYLRSDHDVPRMN